jgi:hypothetical protein
VPLQVSRSDLVSFEWSTNGITADFILPDDDAHLLRVSFDKRCIVRILDEMPLSTEQNDTPNEGLVSEHFAYWLEGAAFASLQSSAWKEVSAPVTHYQLVTGWACLDVLTAGIRRRATVEARLQTKLAAPVAFHRGPFSGRREHSICGFQ